MKWLLFSVLFGSAINVNADAVTSRLPAEFRATFELYKSSLLVAETQYQLQKTKQQARFESHTELKGLLSLFNDTRVSELSLFDISSARQSKLTSYEFIQTGEKPQHISSTVDWDTHRVSTVIDNTATTTDFKQTLWDNHSILLALISNAGHNLSQLSFNVLVHDKIKRISFERLGLNTLEIEDDENDSNENSKTVAVWQRSYDNKTVVFYLDPSANYFPLKIEKFKNQQLEATLWLTELNTNE
ncbi:MAG: DUF3108 domain-containing protein [Gammaproteobacteria bacterium]|nr:DUF3108 domain-containing protein [Gammaproteobacteria bacterium]